MAITREDTALVENAGAGVDDVTLTKASLSGQDGDVIVVSVGVEDDGAFVSESGSSDFTFEVNEKQSAETDCCLAIAYFAVADWSAAASSWTFAGEANRSHVLIAGLYRGVDNSTPVDVGGSAANGTNDETPDAPDVTTVNDGAWVITSHAASFGGGMAGSTPGAPSGYTLLEANCAIAENVALEVADDEIASAGLQTIGSWTGNMAGTNQAEYAVGTFALKPDSAALDGEVSETGSVRVLGTGEVAEVGSVNISQPTPQYARPDADVTVDGWVDETEATSSLWQSIDEVSPDDNDWVQSGVSAGADIDSISWATTTINKDMGPDDWCAATAEGGDVHSLTHHTDGELYGVSLDGEHIGTCLTDGKITGSQWYKYNPTANTLPTDGAFNGLTHLRSKTNVYATGILSVEDGGGAGVDRIYVWEINASPFDKTRLGYTDDEFATAVTYPAGAGWDYDNEGATKDWAAGSPTFIQAGQGYADGDATYVYAVCTNGGDTYPEDVVHLMRAPRTSAATVANHEFWDGSGWDSDPANASAIITRTGAVMWGACGVYWKPIDRWLITFATSATGDWALYQAPAVTGPYTLVEDQTDFVDTTQKFVFQPNLRQSSADGLTMRMGFSGTGTYDAACWVSGTVTLV